MRNTVPMMMLGGCATAGIDLALALVADGHGHQLAATVARQLVVYLQRSGGSTTSAPSR